MVKCCVGISRQIYYLFVQTYILSKYISNVIIVCRTTDNYTTKSLFRKNLFWKKAFITLCKTQRGEGEEIFREKKVVHCIACTMHIDNFIYYLFRLYLREGLKKSVEFSTLRYFSPPLHHSVDFFLFYYFSGRFSTF